MSPGERESLLALEPELRRAASAEPASRRALSPWLERLMLLLRIYVIFMILVVGIVLARGVH